MPRSCFQTVPLYLLHFRFVGILNCLFSCHLDSASCSDPKISHGKVYFISTKVTSQIRISMDNLSQKMRYKICSLHYFMIRLNVYSFTIAANQFTAWRWVRINGLFSLTLIFPHFPVSDSISGCQDSKPPTRAVFQVLMRKARVNIKNRAPNHPFRPHSSIVWWHTNVGTVFFYVIPQLAGW